MYRLLPLVLVVLLSACSTRVEYPHASTTYSADAIDINTASAHELERLPHIGRKTAEAIVRFRTENGRFRRVEYLLLIRSVSESRFAALRPFVRVGDE